MQLVEIVAHGWRGGVLKTVSPFRYAERVPDARLSPWLGAYWEFTVRDGAPPEHHVPPDGATSLVVITGGANRGAVMISGPWLEPLGVPVSPGTRFVGVRLRPGAVPGAFGLDPETLRDQSRPADALIGELAGRLRSAMLATDDFDAAAAALDACFLASIARMRPVDAVVDRAVAVLSATHGERPIAALAADVGVSERTLLRRFKAATGITPKQFARVRRLLGAAWQLVDGEETWGRIAAGAGYADQPHLTHDFVGLTGLSPEDFGDRVRQTEHDRVKP